MRKIIILSLLAACSVVSMAKDYHVSIKGNDSNNGTESAPFRTINRAAQLAYPGDVITVHAGIYREWVNTPYFLPHSTDVAGLFVILGGDNRFLNNLFVPVKQTNEVNMRGKCGLSEYQTAKYPMIIDGNVYYGQCLPFEGEKNNIILNDFDPAFKIEESGNDVFISVSLKGLGNLQTEIVTTEKLGTAKIPKQAFEQPDGQPIVLDTDYFGNSRSKNPLSGPFEQIKNGEMKWKVW